MLAARRLVPGWLERGEGYFVSTASAAGLLTQIGDVVYSVTKHAAVAFAEWLSITYGDRGLRVSCLCPMGVNTPLLNAGLDMEDAPASVRASSPRPAACSSPRMWRARWSRRSARSASSSCRTLRWREFLRRKGDDPERWLAGMRRLQSHVLGPQA